MSTVTKSDLVREYARALRGFGLSRADLPEPHDGDGEIQPKSVARDLEVTGPDHLHDRLCSVLARSKRGIEAPREYWSRAPAFQLTDVLEPFGYEVEFESEGEDVDEQFEVVLRGGPTTGTRRMVFSYPDSPYGADNYPALVHAVENRLLPEPELTFVRLANTDDADNWRFVLVERDRLSQLRRAFGERLDVFGQPLLAEDQPADFATADTSRGPANDDEAIEEVEALVSSGIDDVFHRIEREAATQPVRGPHDAGQEDIDPEVAKLLQSVDVERGTAALMGEVTPERIEGILDRTESASTEGSSFEWVSVDEDARTAPGQDRTATEPAGNSGRLSEQVSEALFPGGDDESSFESPTDTPADAIAGAPSDSEGDVAASPSPSTGGVVDAHDSTLDATFEAADEESEESDEIEVPDLDELDLDDTFEEKAAEVYGDLDVSSTEERTSQSDRAANLTTTGATSEDRRTDDARRSTLDRVKSVVRSLF